MKTNTKRAINIILSLAMMISLVTVLGGVALAAPELSDVTAKIEGDAITFEATLGGVDSSKFASLRAIDKDTGKYVYLNQYTLAVGKNAKDFPVSKLALKGKVLKIIVAAGVGVGTQEVFLAIDVDKDALEAALAKAPAVEAVKDYSERSWVGYPAILATAKTVFADPYASQLEVDAACDALVAALAKLELLITSIKINAVASVTVKRGDKITFTFETNKGAYIGDVVWKSSNPLYATVTNDGKVTVLQKTGTVIITAVDQLTGISHSITLRIT